MWCSTLLGSVEGSVIQSCLVAVNAAQAAQTFYRADADTHQNKVHWGNPSAARPSVCTLSGSGGPIRWRDHHLWKNKSITWTNTRDVILLDTFTTFFLLFNNKKNKTTKGYF